MKQLAQDRTRQRQALIAVAHVFDILVGREKFPVARIGAAKLGKRVCSFGSGKHDQVRRVEHAVLVLQKKRPHLITRLEHEVRNARRHIDGEIGVQLEAPGDVIDVGLHATEVCANHAQLGIVRCQVIARRKDGRF